MGRAIKHKEFGGSVSFIAPLSPLQLLTEEIIFPAHFPLSPLAVSRSPRGWPARTAAASGSEQGQEQDLLGQKNGASQSLMSCEELLLLPVPLGGHGTGCRAHHTQTEVKPLFIFGGFIFYNSFSIIMKARITHQVGGWKCSRTKMEEKKEEGGKWNNSYWQSFLKPFWLLHSNF